MNIILVALSLFLTLVGVLSECPNINDLPVLNDDGDEFYCAWSWHDWGDAEPINACNGDERYYMDGLDYDVEDGYYRAVGSMIVKAGCTFYGYEDYNYSGRLIKYYGPATFPDGCTGGQCPKKWGSYQGFHSMKCRCDQDPIICQPSDSWRTIMQCDNTQSSAVTTCTYSKTIGTTWSESTTNSFNIDVSVEMAMKTSFFGLMEESLTVTGTTGYDWSHMSSESQSETETFQVSTDVPPYTMLQIQGAEGDCGEENVKTELFKTITLDPEGNVLSEKVEKFDRLMEGVELVEDIKENKRGIDKNIE